MWILTDWKEDNGSTIFGAIVIKDALKYVRYVFKQVTKGTSNTSKA